MGYTPDIIVRTPLSGMVHIEEFAPITGHPYFNRQKRIKQTGSVYTLYPGATHSRYEHAIDTLQATRDMATKGLNVGRDITPKELQILSILALLHDIPHGPYSHQSEFILQRHAGKTHTDLFIDVVHKYFKEALEKCGVFLEDVERVWKSPTFEIIDAIHGTDKLSYIRGDAFHVFGERIDLEPLLTWAVRDPESGFCIDEKGVPTLRHYLEKWYQMHNDVYWQKNVLANSTLMFRAMDILVRDGKVTVDQLMEMDDVECDVALNSHPEAAKFVKRIHDGPLSWYKPVVAFKMHGHENSEVRERGKGVELVSVTREQAHQLNEVTNHGLIEVEKELFSTFGVPLLISTTPQPERLLVRNPKVFSSEPKKGVVPLSSHDPAFYTYLEKKADDMWVARVIVPPEERRRLLTSAEEVANIVLDRVR